MCLQKRSTLLEILNAADYLRIGSATDLGIQLQLPIANALVDSTGARCTSRFYVPGLSSACGGHDSALAEGFARLRILLRQCPAFRLLRQPGAWCEKSCLDRWPDSLAADGHGVKSTLAGNHEVLQARWKGCGSL